MDQIHFCNKKKKKDLYFWRRGPREGPVFPGELSTVAVGSGVQVVTGRLPRETGFRDVREF